MQELYLLCIGWCNNSHISNLNITVQYTICVFNQFKIGKAFKNKEWKIQKRKNMHENYLHNKLGAYQTRQKSIQMKIH